MQETEDTIKQYVLEEFLPGEDPELLTNTTPLVSGGIIDSLATLRLIAFLEEHFQIEVEAHETGVEYLDTIEAIAQLVESKR